MPCWLVATNERAELQKLKLLVQEQRGEWARLGDAWAPPTKGEGWGEGQIVNNALQNALTAKDVDWPRLQQAFLQRAKVDATQHEVCLYLSKVRGGQQAQLRGPKRDAKGHASPRWRAALRRCPRL